MWHVHELHLCHYLWIKMLHVCGRSKYNWCVVCQLPFTNQLLLAFVIQASDKLNLKKLWIHVEYTKCWLSISNTKVRLQTLRKKQLRIEKVISLLWNPHKYALGGHCQLSKIPCPTLFTSLMCYLFHQHQNTCNKAKRNFNSRNLRPIDRLRAPNVTSWTIITLIPQLLTN
jgi:hypothetical protein